MDASKIIVAMDQNFGMSIIIHVASTGATDKNYRLSQSGTPVQVYISTEGLMLDSSFMYIGM
jgi:hypothetical protein